MSDIGDILLRSGALLFSNGQTTERMVDALERLGKSLGFDVVAFPSWGELIIRVEGAKDTQQFIILVKPAAIHMGKVAATMAVIDMFCAAKIDAMTLNAKLSSIERYPSVSLLRLIVMGAAGATALGVIFGAQHTIGLGLIAISAGSGAALRRWLARFSTNLLIQPFCASLLAGMIGALAVKLQISSESRLIAVCPCMVLVPGAHLLNGMLDLTRGRIPIGVSRVVYVCLLVAAICVGLFVGLALGGVSLPVAGPSIPDELGYDIAAAGIAVAAYGSFFSMPWRSLPLPILVGMFAHAVRWMVISQGASLQIGAFVACLIAGCISTPMAAKLRFPFAAFAFAAVVSLIPGIFLFRMAGGIVEMASLGVDTPLKMLLATVTDGITALTTLIAMAVGLIVPKLFINKSACK